MYFRRHLFDETIRQAANDGVPLVTLIEAAGAIPGVKVDLGVCAENLMASCRSMEKEKWICFALRKRHGGWPPSMAPCSVLDFLER